MTDAGKSACATACVTRKSYCSSLFFLPTPFLGHDATTMRLTTCNSSCQKRYDLSRLFLGGGYCGRGDWHGHEGDSGCCCVGRTRHPAKMYETLRSAPA